MDRKEREKKGNKWDGERKIKISITIRVVVSERLYVYDTGCAINTCWIMFVFFVYIRRCVQVSLVYVVPPPETRNKKRPDQRAVGRQAGRQAGRPAGRPAGRHQTTYIRSTQHNSDPSSSPGDNARR